APHVGRHDPPRLGDHGRRPVNGVHPVSPLCQPHGEPARAAPYVKHLSASRGQRPQEALVVVGIVVPGNVDHGCDPRASAAIAGAASWSSWSTSALAETWRMREFVTDVEDPRLADYARLTDMELRTSLESAK